MQLSQKQKTFSHFPATFLKYSLSFELFDTKYEFHRFSNFEIKDSENVVRQMSKNSVSEDPPTSLMINVPKHC